LILGIAFLIEANKINLSGQKFNQELSLILSRKINKCVANIVSVIAKNFRF